MQITTQRHIGYWVLVVTFLVSLPFSAVAQNEPGHTVGTDDAEIASSSEVVTKPQPVTEAVAQRPYDTYKREELPQSSVIFSDFVVGPGRFELQIAPGESETVLLSISNRLGDGRVFSLTTEDIATDEADSSVSLLGDTVGPYTIKDYISVPYTEFYIEHNQRVIVPVTVSIPADAEPGGFYGSILSQVISLPEDVEGNIAPSTPVVNRIATLFYVTTPGDINQAGELKEFSTIPKRLFFLSGPIKFGLTFENTGSVHLTPSGNMTITNILGEEVGFVEMAPWFVLPGAIRTRDIEWNRDFLFGRYTAEISLSRGYEGVVDVADYSFWVIPWKLVASVFGGSFIFFLLVRFFIRNFEFKRK